MTTKDTTTSKPQTNRKPGFQKGRSGNPNGRPKKKLKKEDAQLAFRQLMQNNDLEPARELVQLYKALKGSDVAIIKLKKDILLAMSKFCYPELKNVEQTTTVDIPNITIQLGVPVPSTAPQLESVDGTVVDAVPVLDDAKEDEQ